LPRIFLSKDEREIFRTFELLLRDKRNLAFTAKDYPQINRVPKIRGELGLPG